MLVIMIMVFRSVKNVIMHVQRVLNSPIVQLAIQMPHYVLLDVLKE